RHVGAEVDGLPAVAAQRDSRHHQPELVALAGRAGEHGDAAHAAARVGEQVAEPRADCLADEVLLRHGELAGLPAVADRSQQRLEHLAERRVDPEERERLVEADPDVVRLSACERVEDRPQVVARAPCGLADRPEQLRGLADAIALVEALAQPFHARDVALRVAALSARGPVGLQDPVPLLPFAQRVRRDSGALRERSNVESGRHRFGGTMPGYAPFHARGGRAAPRRPPPAGARGAAGGGRDAAPARGDEAPARAPRRPGARVGRGRREEPAAPLRRRPRPAEPSPDDRTLARRAPGRSPHRPAVARPARRRARGGALERTGARARAGRRPHGAPRAGHPRDAARPRRDRRARAHLVAGPGGRRRAARPAARGGDREHVEGRGALADACLPLARAARRRRRRAARDARRVRAADARPPRRRTAAASRVPARRPCLSPLREGDPLVSAGSERAHRLLVSRVPERRQAARGVRGSGMRSPRLYDTLRRFCLGSFAALHGADLPFAFEEHGTYGRPTLYEYRPLVRGFVEAQADRLYVRDDVRQAVAELLAEPAARIFARAHEGNAPDEGRALYRSVLVPLLVRTAEGCGGFDWDDAAYDRAYEELEAALYREGHAYGAVAPLVGISVGAEIQL